MLYKFKSKATGDLIMLGAHGDALLRAIGRTPSSQGIIEVGAMPAVLAAIERAVAADEAARQAAGVPSTADEPTETERPGAAVSLRQRVWPMVEMLRRAHAAGEPVVWGV